MAKLFTASGETRPQMIPLVMRKHASPEALMAALDVYRAEQRANEEPITWAGTARVVGVDRQTLWEYLKGKREGLTDAWLLPLKDAAQRVEEQDEIGLRQGKNVVGFLFALKNRGWADRQEIEHSAGDGWGDLMSRIRSTTAVCEADSDASHKDDTAK